MFSHEKAHLSPQMSEKQFASEPLLLLRVMNHNGSNHALLGIPQITTMPLVSPLYIRFVFSFEKTGLRGFQPGQRRLTQTGLYSHRRCLHI